MRIKRTVSNGEETDAPVVAQATTTELPGASPLAAFGGFMSVEPHLSSRAVARLIGVSTHTLAVWRLTGKGRRGHFHINPSLVVLPGERSPKLPNGKER